MKTLSTFLAATLLAAGGAAGAQMTHDDRTDADRNMSPEVVNYDETDPDYKVAPEVVVLERNDRGMATLVRVNDRVYDVCMNDRQNDCIQPRAAGLGFGERPLSYWPGE